MPWLPGEIVGIEKEFYFDVLGHPFHGFADLITRENDGLVIYDHKAKALKPYSGRKKPTKTDLELSEYARQLYLYAEATKQSLGEYPKYLVFNCYRVQNFVRLDFDSRNLDETLRWADEMIQKIRTFDAWKPDIDYFKCRNLCGLNDRCDYYELM